MPSFRPIPAFGPCLAWALLLAAPAASRAGSGLFTAFRLDAQGAWVVPMGNLRPVLDPGPGLGMRLSTPYYGPLDAFVFVEAARMEAFGGALPVLYGGGGPGLEWNRVPAWLPHPGAGAALYLARVDADDDPEGRYVFLHGAESEFGLFASLRWEAGLASRAVLSASLRWDEILTSPESSRLLSASLGFGWRWR